MEKRQLNYKIAKPGVAMGLLFCTFIFCLILTGVLLPFISKICTRPESAVRIAMVIQDLLVFILPAIATALVVTRLPARLLAIDQKPKLWQLLCTILVMMVSIPAMNFLIEWNQNISFPESLKGMEQTFRMLEENAASTVKMLMTGASVPSLIVSVLIVGVLAGLSEELFFRGAFQRLIMMTRLNPHIAIWVVAFIFSAFHFQFFGFVPRLLLGAFFGYLLWWSGCVWIPVFAHIFNNSLATLSEYYSANTVAGGEAIAALSSFGSDPNSPVEIISCMISLVLTVIGIIYLRKSMSKNGI